MQAPCPLCGSVGDSSRVVGMLAQMYDVTLRHDDEEGDQWTCTLSNPVVAVFYGGTALEVVEKAFETFRRAVQ